MMKESSKRLAKSGIMLAILMVLLYLKTILNVYQIAFYFIASLIPMIIISDSGYKEGIKFIIASFVLSLVLPIEKLSLLLFYTLFGIYPLIKFFVEKIKSLIVLNLVKLVYISLVFFLNYYFASMFLNILPKIMLEYNMWLVFGLTVIAFFLYDYALTRFFTYYQKRKKGF